MVEAIRVTVPCSTHSRRLCCWRLLKYCISSRYKRMPPDAPSVPMSESTDLMSLVEAVVPLSLCSCIPLPAAMMLATVVLPTPDGP